MIRALRIANGCLGLLKRRAREVGQPGMTIYAEAGQVALQQTAGAVRDLAHRNEITEQTLADRVQAMVADGKIDANELRELEQVPATLTRCAHRSHDITEAVSL